MFLGSAFGMCVACEHHKTHQQKSFHGFVRDTFQTQRSKKYTGKFQSHNTVRKRGEIVKRWKMEWGVEHGGCHHHSFWLVLNFLHNYASGRIFFCFHIFQAFISAASRYIYVAKAWVLFIQSTRIAFAHFVYPCSLDQWQRKHTGMRETH